MPKNVMKLLKRVPNHARNAFDMSHRHLVTANFGELLPITCIETIPGDYVELSVSDLLRAAPMVTSPFLRAKQHIDVYYVPYHDLWSKFEQFYTKRNEPKSAGELGLETIPYINIFDLQRLAYSSNLTDIHGNSLWSGASKLLDLLGYGRLDLSGTSDDHVDVNLWRLAAYNKIWYEHYRQQYYDSGANGFPDDGGDIGAGIFYNGKFNPAVLFNFDDILCTGVPRGNVLDSASQTIIIPAEAANRVAPMCQMRYRLWKKDLFTGLLPSTQFGNVSSVFFGSGSISDLVTEFNLYHNDSRSLTLTAPTYVIAGNRQSQGSQLGLSNSASSYNPDPVSFTAKTSDGVTTLGFPGNNSFNSLGFDVLSLRKSEALQIWREAALTAGNRVSDNLRAHLGADAEYNNHESRLIGSISSALNISDVNSTSQVGSGLNQSLGDVAGKGISSIDQNVIKFKAKDFGIIMVMFSMLPEAEYESKGIDRMNQLLEQEDYFIPEYQDLGLEPVSSLEFFNNDISASKVVGYAPRYIGYKQKIDKCFRGFWQDGNFAPWASPKTDVTQVLANNSNIPLSVLYVNKNLFNRNFVASADLVDQFICDFFFDCTKVSSMSVSGLPRM